jgi:putative sigma-54 modulation protein
MHLTITGRNMEVTPALREYAQDKIGKMEKYLHKITSAHIVLAVEKYRHIAEVTIQAYGFTLKGVGDTGDMYSSIDQVMDKIEIQARKLKDKLKDKNKGQAGEGSDAAPVTGEGRGSPAAAEERPRIVRSEEFDPRPMTAEEAAMQMELSAALFKVFVDSRSNKVNVLYRRENGDFGLIETM